MDTEIVAGIVGGLVGVGGAMFLTTVSTWIDDNKTRGERRTLIEVLIEELEARLRILRNRHADGDTDDMEEFGDIVKRMNRGKSGVTFNYEEELAPYSVGFELVRDRLSAFNPRVAVSIVRHYSSMAERLLAHRRLMDPPHNDDHKAKEKLEELRSETETLIGALKRESERNRYRWYHEWLLGLV